MFSEARFVRRALSAKRNEEIARDDEPRRASSDEGRVPPHFAGIDIERRYAIGMAVREMQPTASRIDDEFARPGIGNSIELLERVAHDDRLMLFENDGPLADHGDTEDEVERAPSDLGQIELERDELLLRPDENSIPEPRRIHESSEIALERFARPHVEAYDGASRGAHDLPGATGQRGTEIRAALGREERRLRTSARHERVARGGLQSAANLAVFELPDDRRMSRHVVLPS
jgi:hypothetical protein